jgi:hypothetical protein
VEEARGCSRLRRPLHLQGLVPEQVHVHVLCAHSWVLTQMKTTGAPCARLGMRRTRPRRQVCARRRRRRETQARGPNRQKNRPPSLCLRAQPPWMPLRLRAPPLPREPTLRI